MIIVWIFYDQLINEGQGLWYIIGLSVHAPF